MILVTCFTGFFGYLFVYAAVHRGGIYATAPWKALFAAGGETAAADGSGGGGQLAGDTSALPAIYEKQFPDGSNRFYSDPQGRNEISVPFGGYAGPVIELAGSQISPTYGPQVPHP